VAINSSMLHGSQESLPTGRMRDLIREQGTKDMRFKPAEPPLVATTETINSRYEFSPRQPISSTYLFENHESWGTGLISFCAAT
jgi:hypothetical protein